ncbi:MAG: PD-(D/E)XK nuclease family protein [Deltaproteobacteria bacterium]|nr:PD-(D/E)XK nuclease family protein [Deltaproteobacteria bacterium]
MAGTLWVVRDRAHAGDLADGLGPHDAALSLAELFDRLGDWGLEEGGAADERSDDAVLFACAATLAGAGPRLASDARALHAALAHGRTSAAEVRRALADGQRAASLGAAGGELPWLLEHLEAAEARLRAAGVVGAPSALARALELLHQGRLPPFLARFTCAELLGLVDPTDLELCVLLALGRAGLPLCATLPFDSANRGLLAGVEPVLGAFEAAHGVERLEVRLEDVAEPALPGGPLGPLVRAWYATDGATVGDDVPVEIALVPDGASEAREVARVVAAWRAADPSARIAVALRSVGDDDSGQRVADALLRHDLHARVRRRPLVDTPAARLLLDVLALALHGAPRDRLLAVLASPVRKGALALEEVARVHRALRLAAARTDVEDAARTSGGYRHRLERFAAGADERDEREAARDALELLTPLLTRARALPEEAPLQTHLRAIAAVAHDLLAPDAHVSCAEVSALVASATAMAERVARPGDEALPLSAAARLVEGMLRAAQARATDAPGDGPEILSLPELWGRRFDHVVVAGCVEGRLPRTERPERLLSDLDRASINQALGRPALRLFDDDPLATAPVPRTQALEPVWMLGALRAAGRSLLLTAARRDARGREVAPSVFLLEALRACGAGPHATHAGRRFPRARSTGDRAVDAARRIAAASLDVDAEPVDDLEPALRARVAFAIAMRDERARFFSRSDDVSALQARAPFAFAVAPERVARTFGGSFGLAREQPLSPTRLEALAGCRWYGFVKEVLKVDVERPAGNAADQRVIGTLAHAVMERFFLERKRAGVPATRMTPADRQRVRTLVHDEAAPLLAGRATGHLGAMQAQIAWLATALVRAVSMLAREPPVAGVEPTDLEVQVGASTRARPAELSPVPMTVGSHTLWFGGVIDRVDEGPGGRAVIDYKTASTSSIKGKVKGDALFTTHFQLPLYLRLLEHHRPTAADTTLHAYLVSLLDGTVSADLAALPELRARVLDDTHAEGLAAGIGRVLLPVLAGVLPADPNDRCDRCRVRRVCRVPLGADHAPHEPGDDEGGP